MTNSFEKKLEEKVLKAFEQAKRNVETLENVKANQDAEIRVLLCSKYLAQSELNLALRKINVLEKDNQRLGKLIKELEQELEIANQKPVQVIEVSKEVQVQKVIYKNRLSIMIPMALLAGLFGMIIGVTLK